MRDLSALALLIEQCRTSGVKFGCPKNAPSAEWIGKAENRLGMLLPPTYKWFLANYGGGEICGDEVFSIYGMDFETVFGGDIVFQYLAHQRARTLATDEIPVMRKDRGETYILKTSMPNQDGEYPVFVKRGKQNELYASDFASFLERQIREIR